MPVCEDGELTIGVPLAPRNRTKIRVQAIAKTSMSCSSSGAPSSVIVAPAPRVRSAYGNVSACLGGGNGYTSMNGKRLSFWESIAYVQVTVPGSVLRSGIAKPPVYRDRHFL